MYELAKLVGYLLAPLTVVLALWALSIALLLAHRQKPALALTAAGWLALWIAATPFAADSLCRYLERQYPALPASAQVGADEIFILGGALSGASPPDRPDFLMGPATTRVWYAAELYRLGKAPRIVIAAGNQPGARETQTEAEAIAVLLRRFGVAPEAIELDAHSRNTLENASNLRALSGARSPGRVLLVTSALHMPRALRTFRQVWAGSGTQFIPAATDVGVVGPMALSWPMWMPQVGALATTTRALKEYGGLLALDMM